MQVTQTEEKVAKESSPGIEPASTPPSLKDGWEKEDVFELIAGILGLLGFFLPLFGRFSLMTFFTLGGVAAAFGGVPWTCLVAIVPLTAVTLIIVMATGRRVVWLVGLYSTLLVLTLISGVVAQLNLHVSLGFGFAIYFVALVLNIVSNLLRHQKNPYPKKRAGNEGRTGNSFLEGGRAFSLSKESITPSSSSAVLNEAKELLSKGKEIVLKGSEAAGEQYRRIKADEDVQKITSGVSSITKKGLKKAGSAAHRGLESAAKFTERLTSEEDEPKNP